MRGYYAFQFISSLPRSIKFQVAYYKFFMLDEPTVSSTEQAKVRQVIQVFAQNKGVSYDANILNQPMTAVEKSAFDKIYNVFISPKEIEKVMTDWANKLLIDLRNGMDPRELFAIYYRAFNVNIRKVGDAIQKAYNEERVRSP